VKFNEDHITGSPFPVTISDGGPPKSDATKVRASGKGLVAPKMGPENEFHVNADKAGKIKTDDSNFYKKYLRQEHFDGRNHRPRQPMRRSDDQASRSARIQRHLHGSRAGRLRSCRQMGRRTYSWLALPRERSVSATESPAILSQC
jgi:hypothetical protein